MAMAVTQIASASGALTWMFVEWTQHNKPSVLGIISGAIGGLVAITPAAGFVDLPGAFVIVIVSGSAKTISIDIVIVNSTNSSGF